MVKIIKISHWSKPLQNFISQWRTFFWSENFIGQSEANISAKNFHGPHFPKKTAHVQAAAFFFGFMELFLLDLSIFRLEEMFRRQGTWCGIVLRCNREFEVGLGFPFFSGYTKLSAFSKIVHLPDLVGFSWKVVLLILLNLFHGHFANFMLMILIVFTFRFKNAAVHPDYPDYPDYPDFSRNDFLLVILKRVSARILRQSSCRGWCNSALLFSRFSDSFQNQNSRKMAICRWFPHFPFFFLLYLKKRLIIISKISFKNRKSCDC